ncbi:MAG: hypothetical protein K5755_05695 [Clostridiales bacterium]|nr:hypothetical protein [Clostridia bacterium]MCR4564110.1 hypothetical protein [Clostridiales bacterium]
MAKRKQYDDDDGRTVVDMSGVENPHSLFMPRFPKKEKPKGEEITPEDRPWENFEMSKGERRSFVLGAMSASALIAFIFIAVFGIAIAILFFLAGR